MTIKLRLFALSLCLAIFAPTFAFSDVAFAKEGKGKGNSHKQDHRHEGGRAEGPGGGPYVNVNINFVDVDRRVIYDYYGDVARHGKCPPGLAKKRNGCMPPGQAKKWAIGRPLPRDVIYYPVPGDLLVRISAPPPGYKYVRVASDILMIAAGTGMVAAAIEDLARL
jgi:Ni/Co efflux regulator RcnB